MLNKIVLVVAILLVTTNLWAAKTMGVSEGRHNLSTTSNNLDPDNYYMSNPLLAFAEDEVCIYCHTPHGGALDGPLWNRNLPVATGFTHYTSATLSPYLKGLPANRVVSTESILCMSCHDGAIAINSLLNYSNRTGAQPNNDMKIQGMMGQVGSNIGDIANPDNPFLTQGTSNNLSDDHPISFSYSASQADYPAKLHALGVAKTKGLRFFGPNDFVECSTCHDPHVNYEASYGGDADYRPFLVTPNTGSAMCLACHNK